MVNQILKKKEKYFPLIYNSAFNIELESIDKEARTQTPCASKLCLHEKLELRLDK